MLEPVRCPSCSARYGLRPERVRPGLRRAKCFRCEGIFSIEPEVLRLLGLAPEAAPPPADAAFAEPAILAEDLLIPPPPPLPEPAAAEEPELQDFGNFLTLGDLENGDLMDKTLITPPIEGLAGAPAAAAPGLATAEPPAAEPVPLEPAAEDEPAMDLDLFSEDLAVPTVAEMEAAAAEQALTPPDPIQDTPEEGGGSFSSARDAISKLLGGEPVPAPSPRMKPMSGSRGGGMDVEATLDALESTLGGVKEADLKKPASAALSPADLPPPPEMAATTKLSMKEIQEAMASAPSPDRGAPAGPGVPVMPAARTTAIPRMEPPSFGQPAPLPPPPPPGLSGAGDANFLKVQVGPEVYQNLSVEQMAAWIQEGRILEYHMVARQYSDNWIEASKVPALRPVFERVRREKMGAPGPNETAPIKKSLFSGLFNR